MRAEAHSNGTVDREATQALFNDLYTAATGHLKEGQEERIR